MAHYPTSICSLYGAKRACASFGWWPVRLAVVYGTCYPTNEAAGQSGLRIGSHRNALHWPDSARRVGKFNDGRLVEDDRLIPSPSSGLSHQR